MNEELKPCPFCGEKQDIDYGIMTGTMKGFDYVQCQTCGAEIHAIHKGRYVNAIEAWNRRESDETDRNTRCRSRSFRNN